MGCDHVGDVNEMIGEPRSYQIPAISRVREWTDALQCPGLIDLMVWDNMPDGFGTASGEEEKQEGCADHQPSLPLSPMLAEPPPIMTHPQPESASLRAAIPYPERT